MTGPSTRSILFRAMELARQAVHLDTTNDDPQGAIIAYGESVQLLDEVMIRVINTGQGDSRPNARSREIQEEEVRRLRSIYDSYLSRMITLSTIHNIPLHS